MMKYWMVPMVLTVLGGTSPAPPTGPSQDDLRRLYRENLRLAAEVRQLKDNSAELDRRIEAAQKAIANLQYVERENETYMGQERVSSNGSRCGGGGS